MTADHPSDYGETFAAVYDAWYGSVSDVAATVATVAELTQDRPVVELGVGTGRLALPLAERGHRVIGIDASRSMLARCREKEGSTSLVLIRADMAAIPIGRRAAIGVTFVAFNTFFNLTDESRQRRCLEGVKTMLEPGGRFIVEAFVPGDEPAERQYRESSRPDGAGGQILTTSVRDPADQTVRGVHIHTSATQNVTRLPWAIHYLHPDQLDTLCADTGLDLVDRWSSWNGATFDDSADRHISTYRTG
ncbi:MAG: class I SAM-dependent DNA methyltransferase [Acidimicrobiia bacterium]